jgi:hypothetical protein
MTIEADAPVNTAQAPRTGRTEDAKTTARTHALKMEPELAGGAPQNPALHGAGIPEADEPRASRRTKNTNNTKKTKAKKAKKNGKRKAKKRSRRLRRTVGGVLFAAVLAPVVVQSWSTFFGAHFQDEAAHKQAELSEEAADSNAIRRGAIREADQRDELYGETRVADGQLIRTEAAYKTALLGAPAHLRPGYFLPQVENIRLARNDLYAAKDRLSTTSSVAVFCAAAPATRAHAVCALDLVAAGIARTHQQTYDLTRLERESANVAKKSSKLRDAIRNESGVLDALTTQQPIRDCRPSPHNGGMTP